jgi:hypothetical protein
LLMTLNRVAVLPPVLETARVISRSARRFQIA